MTATPYVATVPILRIGPYRHPITGQARAITREDLNAIASTAAQLSRNGIAIDVTRDNSRSARGRLGRVAGVRVVGGDALMAELRFADAEAASLAQAAGHLNVELEPTLIDGHGRTYRNALAAVSFPSTVSQRVAASLAAPSDATRRHMADLAWNPTT